MTKILKTSPFTITRRKEVLLFMKIAFIKLQHDLLTFRMSRRESWDSTTRSKAVSAQAWRFWHEISGATCRLIPESGCCTRHEVQHPRGCSHKCFSETLKDRIFRFNLLSNGGHFAASHSNGTKQNCHAGEQKARRTGRRQTKEKLLDTICNLFACLAPVCPGFFPSMAILPHADDMLQEPLSPYKRKVIHTSITRESALTDPPELWAPTIGCVTIQYNILYLTKAT